MCKCGCSEAISVPVGPIGPQGPAGECNCDSGLVQFKSIEEIVEAGSFDFVSNTVTSAGDYVIMLEGTAYDTLTSCCTLQVQTFLLKNGVLDTSNTNYSHTLELPASENNKITYTHNAKVTLTTGQTVGFRIITGTTFVDNCSITLFKM